MKEKTRRPLSPEAAQARQNLKRIFTAKKGELGLTQEKAGHALGWGGQSAVGQYLNGYAPLNLEALLKFAGLLKVDPNDIWPGYVAYFGVALAQAEQTDPRRQAWNALYDLMSPSKRDEFFRLLGTPPDQQAK